MGMKTLAGSNNNIKLTEKNLHLNTIHIGKRHCKYTKNQKYFYLGKKILVYKKNTKPSDVLDIKEKTSIAQKPLIILGYLFFLRACYFIQINNFEVQDIENMLKNENLNNISSNILSANIFKFSILTLGVLPCLNSNIVIQLLSGQLDYFKNLVNNNGIKGRIIIEYWNRIFVSLFSLLGSYYYLSLLWPYVDGLSTDLYLFSLLKLVCGSLLTLWVSDKINNLKLGSGLSIIILFNLISNIQIKTLEFSRESYDFFITGSSLISLLIILLS